MKAIPRGLVTLDITGWEHRACFPKYSLSPEHLAAGKHYSHTRPMLDMVLIKLCLGWSQAS